MGRKEATESDALTALWCEAAASMGFGVVRTSSAYAASDGNGRILIGHDEALDADDTVAQLILHELCHAAVAGPERMAEPDWGLDNTSERDNEEEYACLRLQAALLIPLGLERAFAPTTEHRRFYEALDAAPLVGSGTEVEKARRGRHRVGRWPFAPVLQRTLVASRRLLEQNGSGAVGPELARHPSGAFTWPAPAELSPRCGDCAWFTEARCVKSTGVALTAEQQACERYESPLACGNCGACCREGFDVVELGEAEALVQRGVPWVQRRDGRFQIVRDGGSCPGLTRDNRCTVYADRPQACREFEVGETNCLIARQRVGLSW